EVGVGSFSDPEGLEGLAHFLEHMLFYASEKYPGEQDYTKYISEVPLSRLLAIITHTR
uniref:Peptidase M16 N-terminal domain-containing protein n=1 Tax=Aegilops tauschii subsp. strangulata TaxID=200361 RepID=A0A453FP19_AEGTS